MASCSPPSSTSPSPPLPLTAFSSSARLDTLRRHSQPLPDHSPSPSPKTPHDKNRSWHFPGPSTKYHRSERTITPRHTRLQSNYTPTAPILSTERRALHRRAHSLYVPRPSPPEGGVRRPLPRLSTLVRGDMASTHASDAPVTPARGDSGRSTRRVEDSPYSDYFTDEARSTKARDGDMLGQDAQRERETQQLLVRLGKLQSHLMRGENGAHALKVVESSLNEIDRELSTVHPYTTPEDIGDSGLFMEGSPQLVYDNALGVSSWTSAPPFASIDGVVYSPPASPSPHPSQQTDASSGDNTEPAEAADHATETSSEKKISDAVLLQEARRVLTAVTKAQKQLKLRYAEIKDVHENNLLQLEERDQLIEELQLENEGLKSDLGFDHSELLFLKLQLKALEVEIDEGEGDANGEYGEQPGSGTTPSHRQSLLQELSRWRGDWHDVDSRFRNRREKYGVMEKARRDSSVIDELEARRDSEGEWELKTVKKGNGRRVQSITISRTHSDGVGMFVELGSGEVADERGSRENCSCNDRATQTEEEIVSTMHQQEAFDPDEYAVTSSSSGDEADTVAEGVNEGQGRDEMDKQQGHTFAHSAWQELCEGIASLAGVSVDRFE